MNFRSLKENDLASFAENIVDLLAGTDLAAIDSHVRADLVTAFGTLPATLRTQTDAVAVTEDQRMAAVSDRNLTRSQIERLIGRVRDALKAGLGSKKQYDLAGLDYPTKPVAKYTAQNPSGLTATGTSNGVNRLTYTGNNKPTTVVYEIWRREGDDGPWSFLVSVKRQVHLDMPVTPGQYYEYKVRAVAAQSTSNFSNTAVVYGVS